MYCESVSLRNDRKATPMKAKQHGTLNIDNTNKHTNEEAEKFMGPLEKEL